MKIAICDDENITANRYRNVWKYIWTSIIYTGKQKFLWMEMLC